MEVVSDQPHTRIFSAAWEEMGSEDIYTILTRNTSNRPMRSAHKLDLYQKMKDGRYNFDNPELVIIDWNEVLLDGQHRLEAAFDWSAETGHKAKFFVVRNVDPAIYNVLNQGKPRTTADLFSKMVGTKKDDVATNGEKKSSHDKAVVAVAMSMLRSGMDTLPQNWRGDTGAQANFTTKNAAVITAILGAYPKKANTKTATSIYSTPVAAAFANAAVHYGLPKILPLIQRLVSQDWQKGESGPDSMRLLRDLILSAKTAKVRNRLLDRDIYRYSVSAIRSGLSAPKYWVERLIPSDRNFGEAEEWERRIRQNNG